MLRGWVGCTWPIQFFLRFSYFFRLAKLLLERKTMRHVLLYRFIIVGTGNSTPWTPAYADSSNKSARFPNH